MVTNKITIWRKYNHKLKIFEHNHIEEGYCPDEEPTSVSDEQKHAWRGSIWKSKLGLLINNSVVPWMKD